MSLSEAGEAPDDQMGEVIDYFRESRRLSFLSQYLKSLISASSSTAIEKICSATCGIATSIPLDDRLDEFLGELGTAGWEWRAIDTCNTVGSADE